MKSFRSYQVETVPVRSDRNLEGPEIRHDGNERLTVVFDDLPAEWPPKLPPDYTPARFPAGWSCSSSPIRAAVALDGRRAVVLAPPGSPRHNRQVVCGVLPLAMARQGRVCLHAAAAARQGTLLVLAGESGVGKSTLASALARLGWLRSSDDLCFAAWSGDDVLLAETPIRHWSSMAICFLERRALERPEIDRIPARAAFARLLKHGFGELGRVDEPGIWSQQFALYSALVDSAMFLRVRMPDVLERIDETASALDAANVSAEFAGSA